MIKARNKRISLLVAIVFVLTLVLPMGSAFAADNFAATAYSVKNLDDDNNQDAGWIKIKDLDLSDADKIYVNVTLPDNVVFDDDPPTVANFVYITNQDGGPVAFGGGNAGVTKADDDELLFWVTKSALDDASGDYDEAYITIQFNGDGSLDLSDLSEGDKVSVTVEVTGVFGAGETEVWSEPVTKDVGEVSDLDVTVTADTPTTVKAGKTGQKIAEISIKEAIANQIQDGQTITLILPNDDDYQWSTPANDWIDDGTWGLGRNMTAADLSVNADGDELTITFDGESQTKADTLKITACIDVMPNVEDGDIEIEVTSDDDVVNDTELLVARVGESDAEIEVDLDDADDLYPATGVDDSWTGWSATGDVDNNIGTITIKSTSVFSDGDDIFVELSKGVEWYFGDEALANITFESGDVRVVKIYDSGAGLWLEVDTPAADLDEIELTNLMVAVMPDAPVGDVTATFSGVVEGSAKVAEVKAPVTITADKPGVVVALGQAAGNITITETDDETIDDTGYLLLDLPKGVTFSGKPTVEVNGDEVDDSDIELAKTPGGEEDEGYCVVDLPSLRSAKADTIVISDIELDVDERVALGDVKVDIGGSALNGLSANADYDDESDDAIASVAIATLGDASKVTKSFKIGDEGVTAMNGRTLVQVNLLCDTLGLQKSWDAATGTAYFVKDGTIVAFPIGKNVIIINGNTIPVDQGGVAYNNFTYATLRGIAMAFGGELTWDQASQTATFTFTK